MRGRVDIRFTFGLDEEVLSVTKDLTRRTMDALLHLVCLRLPDAGEAFRKEPFAMDSLRRLEQGLTLSILEAQNGGLTVIPR